MTDTSKSPFAGCRPVACALVLLLSLLAARIFGVLYSYAATDIRYAESVFPALLFYARQVLTTAAFGAGIGFIVQAVFSGSKQAARRMLLLHVGILFADALCAFLIDVISGAVSGAYLLLAALSCGAGLLWTSLLAILGWIIAGRIFVRGGRAAVAMLLASALYMAGRLLVETVYLIRFLVSVEFAPYPNEIASIAGEYLGILLMYGAVPFFIACLVKRLFFGRGSQKN